jgi:hypothetical protein
MNRIYLLLTVIISAACSYQPPGNRVNALVFDEETEKEAILRTVENETDCFYRRDYDGWKKNFVHDVYAFQACSNADGTFETRTGWTEADQKICAYIKTSPIEPGQSSHPLVERKNMVIKFFSDSLAYLVWDPYNSENDGLSFFLTRDRRIMEKINGEWKIANISTYWDYKHTIPADSVYNL